MRWLRGGQLFVCFRASHGVSIALWRGPVLHGDRLGILGFVWRLCCRELLFGERSRGSLHFALWCGSVLHGDCRGVLGFVRWVCVRKLLFGERSRRSLPFALWFRAVLHGDRRGVVGFLWWLRVGQLFVCKWSWGSLSFAVLSGAVLHGHRGGVLGCMRPLRCGLLRYRLGRERLRPVRGRHLRDRARHGVHRAVPFVRGWHVQHQPGRYERLDMSGVPPGHVWHRHSFCDVRLLRRLHGRYVCLWIRGQRVLQLQRRQLRFCSGPCGVQPVLRRSVLHGDCCGVFGVLRWLCGW